MHTTPWLDEGKKLIGTHEATAEGRKAVDDMWRDFRMSGLVGTSTTTPWCSAFVGACLERAGIPTRIKNANFSKDNSRYWLDFGSILDTPKYGCIVVFSRNGGGHVGFVVGKTPEGSLLVLGGNQGDTVSIMRKGTGTVLGYRYPHNFIPSADPLPIGNATEVTKLV